MELISSLFPFTSMPILYQSMLTIKFIT